MQAEQHKTLYRWHRLTGLYLMLALLALIITALPLLFIDQLEVWLLHGLPVSSQPIDTWLALAGERFELQQASMYLQFFENGKPSILWVKQGEEFAPWTLLNNLQFKPLPFFDALHVLEHAHFNFLIPGSWGEYLVGAIGLAALFSILIGVILHQKWRSEATQLRRDKSRRVFYSDLHKLLGLWLLPFHLLVTYTGAVLGLGGLLIIVAALTAFEGDQDKAVQAVLGQKPELQQKRCEQVSVESLLAKAENHWQNKLGGAQLSNIEVYGLGDCAARLTVAHKIQNPLVDFNTLSFELASGQKSQEKDWLQEGIGSRWYSAVMPLHFGSFAGLWGQWLYFFSAVLMGAMLLSGLYLYIDKLSKQKLIQKQRWLRFSHAVVLGLSLNSLLLLLLAKLQLPLQEVHFLGLYLAVFACMPFLLALGKSAERIVLLLLVVLAVALAVFDGLYLSLWQWPVVLAFAVVALLPAVVFIKQMQKE